MTITQTLFTDAVLAIRKQGVPAAIPRGEHVPPKCYYYDPDSPLRCAVGHLMDETHAEQAEDHLLDVRAVVEGGRLKREIPQSDLPSVISMLTRMQRAHDDAAAKSNPDFVTAFNQRAAKVASDFNLEMPA